MLNLIPKPKYYEEKFGEFVINSEKTVFADDNLVYAREVFCNFIESVCGFKPQVVVSRKADIRFIYDRHVHKEGYVLDADVDGLVIKASHQKGAFYAVQSLRQLTRGDLLENPEFLTLHAVHIDDEPRYAFRSLMLDEARYFHGVDTVKNILDMMAYHKLNVFHWHLTDNEGWRIEIKKYPRLTEIGGVRKGSQTMAWGNQVIDWTLHEGYYTQSEIKEIVAYAERLNIMIIPEIDAPAHFGAAIAAYKELSCADVEMETPIVHGGTPEKHGIGNVIACAGKESTYQFIYDVIDEVTALFPAPYFHIGGDEAPKAEWQKCPHCQKVMKEMGLKNEEELQGYFNNKIAVYLKRKGKRLIGWNEILTAKRLEKDIIAQYWTFNRDMNVENYLLSGHDIILSKHQAFYFDMPYAQNRLKTTYEFEPEKAHITRAQEGILGIEATLWTEWIPHEERIDYQLYPRMEALAEVAWTPKDQRNYKDFIARLKKFLPILDRNGVEYCPLSLANPKGLKRAKTIKEFNKRNAHVEYNHALVVRRRKKYH